jgi:hypothetical protein
VGGLEMHHHGHETAPVITGEGGQWAAWKNKEWLIIYPVGP